MEQQLPLEKEMRDLFAKFPAFPDLSLIHILNDYKAMNEAYKGRFGSKPPCRTTVAVYGGVPGNSLVEIDCIAYI